MRVAIVEPYLGGSHGAWARGYHEHSGHETVLITHTDRFWKWRMHGAHVTLAQLLEAEVASNGPVDVILASSMLNGAAFLGLTRDVIGDARFVLFMHENQLGYPLSPRDTPDLTYPMVNWTSMVAADRVIFNSEYHRLQWFSDVPRFLRQFPDYQQHHLVAAVEQRSTVLPVGVDLARFDAVSNREDSLARILWNQRWEYDKGTVELAQAITSLDDQGAKFGLILAGEQFPTDPPEFVDLKARLGDRLIHYGWAEPERYVDLVASSDVVISTAHHEYFGISITEAVYSGAFPVLPNRLVYPERIPEPFHDRCLYDDGPGLVDRVVWAIRHPDEAATMVGAMKPAMAVADWSEVAPQYDAELAATG